MSNSEKVKLRLRYWNCRGRVQAVRWILTDLQEKYPTLDYQEEFESLENGFAAWLPHKADENYSGPFHNLPVLVYNDQWIFGQTLTIGNDRFISSHSSSVVLGQFLARKFDLYGQLTSSITDREILYAFIDGVVSCAYTDIITNILTCVWEMADFIDESKPINRMARKIPADLQALNTLLKKSSTPFFYDQPEPTIADYFVFEAFTAAKDYCQKLLPAKEDREALVQLEHLIKQRPGPKKYFDQGSLFKRFSGSPKEAEYIADLATKHPSTDQ